MPAPGAQHNGIIPNPFVEEKPPVSAYTAQEIATLQCRLEKQLGPEYISARAGPGGQKIHYVAAEKCIQLANEVFGFNGWSSSIRELQVDFVDENATTGKISIGLSVIVRVTLRDGTYHEDIGYGSMDNSKSKAAAFEKAKKEGTTDGLKRALRNFGNVLGNCIYDKEYLTKVTKVKAAPSSKWDADNLHRHSTYAPLKKEPELPVPDMSLISIPDLPNGESIDEFGDFDAADFTSSQDLDYHPDEVILPAPEPASNVRGNGGPQQNTNGSNAAKAQTMQAPVRTNNGFQTANTSTKPSLPSHPQNVLQTSNTANKPTHHVQPQTPNAGLSRSSSGAGNVVQETKEPVQMKGQPQKFFVVRVGRKPGIYDSWGEANDQTKEFPGFESKVLIDRNSAEAYLRGESTGPAKAAHPSAARPLTQATKSNSSSRNGSPVRQQTGMATSEHPHGSPPFVLGAGTEPQGFFSARAAAQLPQNPGEAHAMPSAHLRFDPKFESPSIRRTPGIDHNKSKPTTRDLKHVPGSTQSAAPAPTMRTNAINPSLDAMRRVGVPGGNPSPLANRNQYKPPTRTKRPSDGDGVRPPLSDRNPNGPVQPDGGDAKRQRMNGAQ